MRWYGDLIWYFIVVVLGNKRIRDEVSGRQMIQLNMSLIYANVTGWRFKPYPAWPMGLLWWFVWYILLPSLFPRFGIARSSGERLNRCACAYGSFGVPLEIQRSVCVGTWLNFMSLSPLCDHGTSGVLWPQDKSGQSPARACSPLVKHLQVIGRFMFGVALHVWSFSPAFGHTGELSCLIVPVRASRQCNVLRIL